MALSGFAFDDRQRGALRVVYEFTGNTNTPQRLVVKNAHSRAPPESFVRKTPAIV